MRISKEEQARREGMSYALRVAKKKGIDGLEAELKSRNALDIPVRVSKADLAKFTENVKMQTMECVLALAAITLRDEFDFGSKRMERFVKRFWDKADCINDDYTTWQETLDTLRDECGIVFEIHGTNENDTLIGRERIE